MRTVMTANFKTVIQLLSWWWQSPCRLHRVKSYTDISIRAKAQRTNSISCSKLCFSLNHLRFFILLFWSDESETMGLGLELGTEMRTHSAFFLACSILYPDFAGSNSSHAIEVLLAFFCTLLFCLDKCLALRRRKWSCPNLEFSLPRTSNFTFQIQVCSFNNRIWIKLMDCWWYYVKLSCVTCGITNYLSLLITPILKEKIK
jgi:hypothetical protein